MVELEVKQAIEDIRKRYRGLTQAQINLAVSRAINRTISSARSAAIREIKKRYNIKPKYLKEKIGNYDNRYNAIRVWQSNRGDLTGKILAYGRPIPIFAFPLEKTPKGVSVSILKGERKEIPKVFIAKMKSGHISAFAKGEYKKGKFAFRTKRVEPFPDPDTPISQILTTSIRAAISEPSVIRAIKAKSEEMFPKRVEHELNRLLARQ